MHATQESTNKFKDILFVIDNSLSWGLNDSSFVVLPTLKTGAIVEKELLLANLQSPKASTFSGGKQSRKLKFCFTFLVLKVSRMRSKVIKGTPNCWCKYSCGKVGPLQYYPKPGFTWVRNAPCTGHYALSLIPSPYLGLPNNNLSISYII